MSALPIAMPPTAVDNDDEFAGISPIRAFDLGVQWERFRWQFSTFAGGKRRTATFLIHPENSARMCGFVDERRFAWSVTTKPRSGWVRLVVTRRT